MLTLTNIDISRQGRKILHVDSVDLDVGEHIAILGPNGAGKSSLIKVICGEWSLNCGDIYFYQQKIKDWNRRTLACHLGVLPQASKVEFPFTAAEVVAIGATPLVLKKNKISAQVNHYLANVDALHLAALPYAQLSGGEKQRVQFARVLLQLSQATQPPLLLLDEPTSAQDLGHQHQLLNGVRQLTQSLSMGVISVLHDLNLASRYCDKIWLIDQQRLQMFGTPEVVLTPSNVEQHWHYLPQKITGINQGFGLL